MKKRLVKILTALILAVILLVSCSTKDPTIMKFKVNPSNEYNTVESVEDVKARIIVTIKDKDYTLIDLEQMGAKILGLDFSKEGSHTLTILYDGLTLSYDYIVKGYTVLTDFEAIFKDLNLGEAEEGYVFGFNYKTGEVGLYNKTTGIAKSDNSLAGSDIYFVANKAEDINPNSANGYIIADNITLDEPLIMTNPVDMVAINGSITGDVELYTSKKVNVTIDTDIYGTLTIDCPKGHIEHSGQANKVEVKSVSETTYAESGVVSELVAYEDSNNIVINSGAIVYTLDVRNMPTAKTVTNNGVVYKVLGKHEILGDGFVFQGSKNDTFDLPGFAEGESGSVTIDENGVVESATFNISEAEGLFYFSCLTQSGSSPLIKHQPLVTVNLTAEADIDMKDINWVPIANWNYWANGTASRWFAEDTDGDGILENGWKNYVEGKPATSSFDFISADEMYCRAFYNENYIYNNRKIAPIYYIRLVLNGNSNTITNLDNSFIGCLGYGSKISNLNVNYDVEEGVACEAENGQLNLIWNNLDGINYPGFLEGNCTTHFGLFCNNLYIPKDANNKPMGEIEFNGIAIGGKFIYRNNITDTQMGAGMFLIGAFVSCACGEGNNKDANGVGQPYIKFINCALGKQGEPGQEGSPLTLLITSRQNGVEYIHQWGSPRANYDENKKTTINFALVADYCCGTDGGVSSKYMTSMDDISRNITDKYDIKGISHSQGNYGYNSGAANHAHTYVQVVYEEANCYHGTIKVDQCSTCKRIDPTTFVEVGEISHTVTHELVSASSRDTRGVMRHSCSVCGTYTEEVLSVSDFKENAVNGNEFLIQGKVVTYVFTAGNAGEPTFGEIILMDLDDNSTMIGLRENNYNQKVLNALYTNGSIQPGDNIVIYVKGYTVNSSTYGNIGEFAALDRPNNNLYDFDYMIISHSNDISISKDSVVEVSKLSDFDWLKNSINDRLFTVVKVKSGVRAVTNNSNTTFAAYVIAYGNSRDSSKVNGFAPAIKPDNLVYYQNWKTSNFYTAFDISKSASYTSSDNVTKQDMYLLYVGGSSTAYHIFTLIDVVDSITINQAPTKQNYIIGENLDLTGGSINVKNIADYMTSSITKSLNVDGVSVSGYDCNTSGNQTVTVTYAGQTCTFDVYVSEDAYLAKQEIDAQATTVVDFNNDETPSGTLTLKLADDSLLAHVNSVSYEVVGEKTHNATISNNVLTYYHEDTGYTLTIKATYHHTDKIDFVCQTTFEVYVSADAVLARNEIAAQSRIINDYDMAAVSGSAFGTFDLNQLSYSHTNTVQYELKSNANGTMSNDDVIAYNHYTDEYTLTVEVMYVPNDAIGKEIKAQFTITIHRIPTAADVFNMTGGTTITSLTEYGKECTSIIVPDTVTVINDGSFAGANKVQTLQIPFTGNRYDHQGNKNFTQNALFGRIFGKTEFEGSAPITQSVYKTDDSVNSSTVNDVVVYSTYTYYIPTSLKKVIVTKGSVNNQDDGHHIYPGVFDNVQIETLEITGDNIVDVRNRAFFNMTKLKTLILPDSLTKFTAKALAGCGSLELLKTPFIGTNITNSNVSGSTDATLGVMFGQTAYENASQKTQYNSKKYYIPNGLKTIIITKGTAYTNSDIYLFNSCLRNVTSLKTIVLGEDIDNIATYAFYGCTGLTKVYWYQTIDSEHIGANNDRFNNATKYTFTTNGASETTAGNWWYFAADGYTVVEKVVPTAQE